MRLGKVSRQAIGVGKQIYNSQILHMLGKRAIPLLERMAEDHIRMRLGM